MKINYQEINMKYVLILTGIILIFPGCMSVVEKTGRFIDGSMFAEKTISVYRALEKEGAPSDIEITIAENKDNEKSMIFTVKKYPMMALRASYPGADGSFHFTSLEYLSGSTHGWIEFSLQLIGTGTIIFNDTDASASLKIYEIIESVNIIKGKIDRYDTRITGSDAVMHLRNRRERITALTEWMTQNPSPQMTLRGFHAYWQPVLLPETVPNRRRPENWRNHDDQFSRAEDINWNTGYTERLFPEDMRLVRDSGTLLRDWEEALYWIYLEYEWENIINLFDNNIIFKKVK